MERPWPLTGRDEELRRVAAAIRPGAAGIVVAGSYDVTAGPYSGAILTRIAAADPIFGPALITLANGTTQPNPLATTNRFKFPTRGDDQVLGDRVHWTRQMVRPPSRIRTSCA